MMKNVLRATSLSCAAIAVSFVLSISPVHATDNSDAVRSAQMRLSSLGYYVGRYDGTMGPVTQQAIIDFQRTNGLAITGQLTPETFSMLDRKHYATYQPAYYLPRADYTYYQTAYDDRVLLSQSPVAWDDRWHYVHAQVIPSRFGKLDMIEDDRGSLRHYEVMLNGQPVLFANNQPQVLHVSHTYALNGEDAVIFTAYHGESNCAYKQGNSHKL